MTVEDKSLAQLHKELRDVERAIEVASPLLYKQMVFLREVIAHREAVVHDPAALSYVDMIPKDAIIKCLSAHGTWMSKRTIIDELEAGGQIKDKINGRNLINDSINYLLKRKTPGLVTRDGKPLKRGDNSMELLVGLPIFRRMSSK